jgi:hypothetical protein
MSWADMVVRKAERMAFGVGRISEHIIRRY